MEKQLTLPVMVPKTGIIRMYFGHISVKFELWNMANSILYQVNNRDLGYPVKNYNDSVPGKMAKIVADVALRNNFTAVEILVSGANNMGREQAISTLQELLDITIIKDVTPIWHNFCKPPSKKYKK